MKVAISGGIQTGSYTNKDGNKVYTTDVVVEEQEFCESKSKQNQSQEEQKPPFRPDDDNSFMQIPDTDFETLPFN